MYYETRPGDDELLLLYRAIQEKLAKENQEADDDDDDDEPISKKPRKSRRSEASILEEESELHGLSPTRSKRVSVSRDNDGQRRIDEFIAKKRSPRKKIIFSDHRSLLPPVAIVDSELCPICDRRIPNDILEVHTNACITRKTDSAQALLEQSQKRTVIETRVKEDLFQRTTRKSLAAHLIKTNSESTTCPTCGMQMTVSRLESQHRKECSNNF